MIRFVSPLLLFSIVLSFGCAGSDEASGRGTLIYSANLGTATLFDANAKSRTILERNQFRIQRVETSADMYYLETEWKNRGAFDDELEQGIEAGLTRIIIQATPRGRAASSDLHTVRLQAENQVRYLHTFEWRVAPMSNMLIAYLKKLSEDFVVEFRTGYRKF
ncbi:MAG: hypothetical protein HYY49_08250 [Ignavibacteriales bacterium]|nr:hypothetical protein [Ignavibacteriales bacterium]